LSRWPRPRPRVVTSSGTRPRPRPNTLKNFFKIHRFIHHLHYNRPRALLAVEKLIHLRRSRERHCLVTTTAQHQQKHHQQWPSMSFTSINTCGTAESPEELMERHSDGVLRPLFSRLLCAGELSSCRACLLPKRSNRQTKPSKDVQQSVGKPCIFKM